MSATRASDTIETSGPRLAGYVLALTLAGIVLGLLVAEVFFRFVESREHHRDELRWADHDELGWLPPAHSTGVVSTGEFTVNFRINSLGMHDADEPQPDQPDQRVLVIGDSHTFATGVAANASWPNQLQTLLFPHRTDGVVFNAAIPGYSVGQYLVRMRGLLDDIKPDLVVIGFSMATDLYDLMPPDANGFVYGAKRGRVYFDLDDEGALLEKRELVGGRIADEPGSGDGKPADAGFSLRQMLSSLALYRQLKRSKLAMYIATRYRPGGKSLWPGMETSLAKNLAGENAYRWQLATAILKQIRTEAAAANAQVALINIPYLAQVYDDVWAASFGSQPEKYGRMIGSKRLEQICNDLGIGFVDTTTAFIQAHKESQRWLHFPKDAHPTEEGHALIANTALQTVRQSLASATKTVATD